MSPFPISLMPALLLLASQEADAPVTPVIPIQLPEAVQKVDEGVSAGELYAHVSILASDEFEGRFTGSVGGQAAADYLAKSLGDLKEFGLEPAGDDGTFLQNVPLTAVSFLTIPKLTLAGGQSLALGSDFELRGGFGFSGELELIVAADADSTPALGQADQAIYMDMPGSRARTMMRELGEEWIASWGAVIERGSPSGGVLIEDPARINRVRAPARPLRMIVRGEGRKAMDGAEGKLQVEIAGRVSKAYNVVAKLPANMPLEAGQVRRAVVLSAHYDHLKPRQVPEGEDGIYNGADDDASGVAALLEATEALCIANGPRNQDLIILLATGEEIGLVGTTYYLDNPVVPLEQTSANLNIEMIGRPDELIGGQGQLWLTGYKYTNLGAKLAEAGLPVAPDPRINQHFFERSDNYAFVLKGIVGQTLSSYNMHKDYHHVTDEADTLDYEHMRIATDSTIATLERLLGPDFEVQWTPGYKVPKR